MNYYKYVVTAHKSTATHFAVKGQFTGQQDKNLMLGKGNRIEIYTIGPDGLNPTLECNIYGTIVYDLMSTKLQTAIDPTNRFIATLLPNSNIAVANTDTLISQSATETAMTLPRIHKSKSGRKSRTKQVALSRLHSHITLDDKTIIAFTFLFTEGEPALMILYDNPARERFLQMFIYSHSQNKLEHGPVVMDHIEGSASVLIALPAPIGGVLLISCQYIRYLKQGQALKAVGISCSPINCHAFINQDGSRLLLGSADGQLHLLILNVSKGFVESLGLIELGNITIPSCLAYLGNNVLYAGSTKSDSQLVYIDQRPCLDENSSLQILETFSNLGPIADFYVADLDKQGQPQMITCSGAGNSGSLRIIRNGVGLNPIVSIEVRGATGIWALKRSNVLTISFACETRLVYERDEGFSPLRFYSAIELHQPTLAICNALDNLIMQVTSKSVRLMEYHMEGKLLDEWFPSQDLAVNDKSTLTIASLNETQCVVSTGSGNLIALVIRDRKLIQVGKTRLESEVTCIDVSPIDQSHPHGTSIIAVGEWQVPGVRLLRFDSQLMSIAYEPLMTKVMPRSVLLASLEGICYLLVALGDGQVYNFKLDPRQGRLWDSKRSFLGKLPVSLGTFTSNGATHVFAASDKPSVIHSRNQKLVYSNVNVKDVRSITSFNSPTFMDVVALVCPESIIIGQMEEIQKLHITTIRVADIPRRITYQESTHTFGLLTEKLSTDPYDSHSTTGAFELLDDQTFISQDKICFKDYEHPLAVSSVAFEHDGSEYYAVATGNDEGVQETSYGRIILLQVISDSVFGKTKQRLRHVHQLGFQGRVQQLQPFNGKLLATVDADIFVFQWQPSSQELVFVCMYSLATLATSISTYGDLITIGDMVASVTLLKYDDKLRCIEEIAADERCREITSLESYNDSLAVGAGEDGHLFVVERVGQSSHPAAPSTSQMPMEDPALETVSEWHLGEIVQKFRFGSLGSKAADINNSLNRHALIYGTVNGGIGLIADLSEDRFKILYHMQQNIAKVVPSFGNLCHNDWRSVATLDRKEDSSHFIDGDLIEGFLDLTPEQMQHVVDGHGGGKKLDLGIDELCKIVEELMSLHS
ncbi:hypothetical protein DM01DRAFT_256916 [Hesseltinella vesiculosa]|uniref:DNA damage-binding protein 1 n=1 Tax=Hesseltinella vesiculosa TaxID=101127 RepID=A0A1X2G8K3_9FUNG|nr:hypothetical protein DM01DRAFT_256916 [Hesseltinella vesiculosa]